jgi:hypothetical protein
MRGRRVREEEMGRNLGRCQNDWGDIPFELRIVHDEAMDSTGRYEGVKGALKAGKSASRSGEESRYGVGVAGEEGCNGVEESKGGRRDEEGGQRQRERGWSNTTMAKRVWEEME